MRTCAGGALNSLCLVAALSLASILYLPLFLSLSLASSLALTPRTISSFIPSGQPKSFLHFENFGQSSGSTKSFSQLASLDSVPK